MTLFLRCCEKTLRIYVHIVHIYKQYITVSQKPTKQKKKIR